MEKRNALYISRKSGATWLMTLFLVGSAVARIVFPGEKGAQDSLFVWSQIVLPSAACLMYVLITLLDGQERFYKTAIPVWMISVYFYFAICNYGFGRLVNFLFAVCLLFFAIIYTWITSGRSATLFLLPVYLSVLATIGYLNRQMLLDFSQYWKVLLLPDVLMMLGLLIGVFAIRLHPAGQYHPTWGDRNDGRRIRTLAPMAQITMYFQWERNICSNLFEESFEISNIERYIRQKRREGLTDFGLTHVLLAAYVRGLCKYPQLNRFISGQKVYSRGEDIQYCMVIKKEMSIDSPDTSIKVHLTRTDTAEDVYHKLNSAVDAVKASKELDSNLDNLIMYFNLIPGVLLKFVVWLLKFLDYFGLLPKFLVELSPFHGSLFFTSMGSLGIPPIYHHLYDFGNLPVFGAFGCKRKAVEVTEDGSVVQKKYLDVKFVLDERIVDGYYYAAFFKHYRSILRHPEILDLPPTELVSDID